jgi:hypothetical protein
MIDHRRLQRVLFRMQLDPHFCGALLAGDERAVRSSGLGTLELSWLKNAGRAAITADKDRKRSGQVLGNITLEYRTSIAVAVAVGVGDRFAEDFFADDLFHQAMMRGERLPIVFGRYAERRAQESAHPLLIDAVQIDRTLVDARRADRERSTPIPNAEWHSAAHVRVIAVHDGTHEFLTNLRSAVDRGRRADPIPSRLAHETKDKESLLVTAKPVSQHRVRDVAVERLEPAVADLIGRAEFGLDDVAIRELATRWDTTTDDLRAFAQSLADDGILESTR